MSQTCYKTIACLLSFTLIVATLILFSTFADTQDNTKVFLILLEIFILLMVSVLWPSIGHIMPLCANICFYLYNNYEKNISLFYTNGNYFDKKF